MNNLEIHTGDERTIFQIVARRLLRIPRQDIQLLLRQRPVVRVLASWLRRML